MTTIEGTIKYKITLDENGTNTEYESTLENDIAAMAIAEFVCGEWIKHIKEEKSNHTGKVKAQINERLLKTVQTQKGLKTLGDYAFAMYKAFKGLEEMRASAEAPETNSEPLQGSDEIEQVKIITDL